MCSLEVALIIDSPKASRDLVLLFMSILDSVLLVVFVLERVAHTVFVGGAEALVLQEVLDHVHNFGLVCFCGIPDGNQ